MAIVEAPVLLKQGYTPNHVSYGRRHEEQARDDAAQIRLWICEYCFERSEKTQLSLSGPLGSGGSKKQRNGNGETKQSKRDPEASPVQRTMDQRPYDKLSCRPTKHAKRLREADSRCQH